MDLGREEIKDFCWKMDVGGWKKIQVLKAFACVMSTKRSAWRQLISKFAKQIKGV